MTALIESVVARRPHGNTKTGMPFRTCEVGGSFEVAPEDYARTNCARAHFQKRMWRLYRKNVRFRSSQVKGPDGRVVAHRFVRES